MDLNKLDPRDEKTKQTLLNACTLSELVLKLFLMFSPAEAACAMQMVNLQMRQFEEMGQFPKGSLENLEKNFKIIYEEFMTTQNAKARA